jgi:predicted ester cyclase
MIVAAQRPRAGTWFQATPPCTEEDTMTTTGELALEVIDAFHADEVDRIGTLVTDDFVDHGAPPWAPQGRAGYLQIMRFLKDVLKIRYEVHEVVAGDDLVAVRATVHGVHNTGHLGFAATGKPYAMPTMHMYRARGGLLAEHWGVRDELSVLWQVGALPVPAPVPLGAS